MLIRKELYKGYTASVLVVNDVNTEDEAYMIRGDYKEGWTNSGDYAYVLHVPCD